MSHVAKHDLIASFLTQLSKMLHVAGGKHSFQTLEFFFFLRINGRPEVLEFSIWSLPPYLTNSDKIPNKT